MSDAQMKHAEKMSSGQLEYSGKLLEARQADWKDEFILVLLSLPILMLGFSVWSDDPTHMEKMKLFFEYFSHIVSLVFGIISTKKDTENKRTKSKKERCDDGCLSYLTLTFI